MNFGCEAALRCGQVGVAGTCCESVGFANRGAGDDFKVEVQIPDHAADDGELLPVLLAKECMGRGDDVEKLRHHGADT